MWLDKKKIVGERFAARFFSFECLFQLYVFFHVSVKSIYLRLPDMGDLLKYTKPSIKIA